MKESISFAGVFKAELPEHIEEVLKNQVMEHRYYLNESLPFLITFEQALFSWYENIYRPIMLLTLSGRVKPFIPKEKGIFDMYFAVTDHWHYMKEESERKGDGLEITVEEAFVDYIKQYGRFTWVSNLIPRSYLWEM